MINRFLALLCCLLLCGCFKSDEPEIYTYEPRRVCLEGKLVRGTNELLPEHYILELEKPIHVLPLDRFDPAFNQLIQRNVSKIRLIVHWQDDKDPYEKYNSLVDQTVKVQGCLVYSKSHRFPSKILLDVQELEILDKQ